MKLRIRGNSIRLRLTQSEVARVAMNGSLESQTVFGARAFRFALVIRDDAFSLSASLDDNAILVSAAGSRGDTLGAKRGRSRTLGRTTDIKR